MDRYHKAARDGYLDALKEATRKDLNTKDEDGMTPTLWASFEGNLDALRLIVGRGGDPDKSDNFGNTALHFASARGHMNCVSFLVNFGVNMWALDIDFHTAKDLAAINNRDDILRYLDTAVAKEESKDPKKAKGLREKSMKDAEKRVKEFDKIQEKARKIMEEEQKKLMKHRKEMEKHGTVKGVHLIGGPPVAMQVDHRPSMAFLSLRKDSRLLYGQSPKFSEIVANSQQHHHHTAGPLSKITGTGVYKKVQQRKGQTMSGTRPPPREADSDFKIRELEDGKRSVRSLSGLRRDSEIMYVPKYDISAKNAGRRGKISGLFEEDDQEVDYRRPSEFDADAISYATSRSGGTVGKRAGSISGIGMSRSISQPEYMHQVGTDSGFTEDSAMPHNIPSIFERPGFGSVAFRNSITHTLATFPNFSQNGQQNGGGGGSSASGASSRKHRDSMDSSESQNEPHADYPSDEEDDRELGAVEVFLAATGLTDYIPIFAREKIDLEALMLLTDEDFRAMGMEMGPRRKLLKAIHERNIALDSPGEVIDSRL